MTSNTVFWLRCLNSLILDSIEAMGVASEEEEDEEAALVEGSASCSSSIVARFSDDAHDAATNAEYG
jgi:hypothetical protein